MEWAEGGSTIDECEVIIAKHRNGGLDNPIVSCKLKYSQFSDQITSSFIEEELPDKKTDSLFNHRPAEF